MRTESGLLVYRDESGIGENETYVVVAPTERSVFYDLGLDEAAARVLEMRTELVAIQTSWSAASRTSSPPES